MGKPEEKRPLGRPRRRLRIILNESSGSVLGGGVMDRIDMAEDRDRWRALVNAVMKLRVS